MGQNFYIKLDTANRVCVFVCMYEYIYIYEYIYTYIHIDITYMSYIERQKEGKREDAEKEREKGNFG